MITAYELSSAHGLSCTYHCSHHKFWIVVDCSLGLRTICAERFLYAQRLSIRTGASNVFVTHCIATATLRAKRWLRFVLRQLMKGYCCVVDTCRGMREPLNIYVVGEYIWSWHPRRVATMPTGCICRCWARPIDLFCSSIH